MKSRTAVIGLIGLFGLFIIFLLIESAAEKNALICDRRREAKVGEDVTLGCNVKDQRDVTGKSIVWKFNRTITVLVYKSSGFSQQDQAEQFKDRASQDSSWNPSKGKLAVKISRFEETDAGEYTCFVGTGSQAINCSTTVVIQSDRGKLERSNTNKGVKGTENMVTLVTLVLVTLVLATSIMLYLQHY